MYMPSFSYDDNIYATPDPANRFSFLGDFLRTSSTLQDNDSFDKAVYLLGIALNGISAKVTPAAYCELLVRNKNCDKALKCKSSCALVAAAIWRLLGLPNRELDQIGKVSITSIINTVVGEFPYYKPERPGRNNKYAIWDGVFDEQKQRVIPLRDRQGEEIFSIGNVIGVAMAGSMSSHYFTVASYPLRVVDHESGHTPYKYLFAGINGGGTHNDKTSDCEYGHQKINTAKMEAYQKNGKWMVRKLTNNEQAVWLENSRELQFYYRTKALLLNHGNRNPCQMPLGIGSGVITWQAVRYPPAGYVNEERYFNPIFELLQKTLSTIGNTLLGTGAFGNLFP